MLASANTREDYRRLTGREATFWRIYGRFFTDAGFRAVCLYRIGRWLRRHRLGVLAGLTRRLMLHWCYCGIADGATIGAGFVIAHVGDIVIGGATRIGRNCDIRQGVTFGGNTGQVRDGQTQPRLGDDVRIGAGAKILGPVRIGSRVMIGANAVVLCDIPDDAVAVGVPARVIRIGDRPIPLTEQSGALAATLSDLDRRIAHLEDRLRQQEPNATDMLRADDQTNGTEP